MYGLLNVDGCVCMGEGGDGVGGGGGVGMRDPGERKGVG